MKSLRYSLLAVLLASPAYADKAPDVDTALKDWVAAVQGGSVDNIMKLYDKDAIMISTFVQNPMTRREQIAGYFKKVVANPDVHVEVQETHPRVFGDMAVDTGRYTLSYTQDGEPVSIPARYSFTYVLRGGKWLIVDQHSSRVPLPDEVK